MTPNHIFGIAVALALSSGAARAEEIGQQEIKEVTVVGQAGLDDGQGSPAVQSDANEIRKDLSKLTQMPQMQAAATAAPLANPTVAATPFAPRAGARGFNGLNHFDQRFAGTGPYANTQFSLEPPDQGLCVGNGFVVEPVNTAIAVYGEDGRLLKGPTALNQFYGAKPEFNRVTHVYGDFLSDPRCLYDRDTNRFFVTVLLISQNPTTGAFAAPTKLLIAVSNSGNPTGRWTVYSINTTDDSSAGAGACPCFGDQPLIGADRNGFFLSTNAFSLKDGFVGAQIYALSKRALANGTGVRGVRFFGIPLIPGGFTIQPALINAADRDDGPRNTEFFASIADITVFLEKQLAVWSLTGTDTLGSTNNVHLFRTVVDTEVFGVPPDSVQQGTPLGNALYGQGLELLSTNEHRLQQVQASDGRLYTALTTILQSPGDTTGATVRAGIAWFVLRPGADAAGNFAAAVERQGYVAADGNNNLFYPSFVSNGSRATIAFALSGPTFLPSAAYAPMGAGGPTSVHVVHRAPLPEDGFSGYGNPNSISARWGDYSAAAIAPDGTLWMATEVITSGPRTLLANWATFIFQVGDEGDGN